MQDSWPSVGPEPEARRAPSLPRVEDLPVVERGYDPDRVREAFDAFYRHLARLDATLRTIEAVEVFRDQAAELRKELRALRTAGWTQQPWLPSYSSSEQVRVGLPEAVFRWALEACLVIAAPVGAYAADLRPLWIVVATAGAFVIVALSEWISWREQPLLPARAAALPPAAPVEEAAPVPLPELEPEPAEPHAAEATEWALPPPSAEERVAEEPAAEAAPAAEAEPAAEEELTEIAPAAAEPAPASAAEAEPAPEPEPVGEPELVAEAEPAPEEPAEGPAAEPEPVAEEQAAVSGEPRRRRFWWRRRDEEKEEQAEVEDVAPRHVRVLPAEETAGAEVRLDPWEEELDVEADAEPEPTHPRPGY